MRATTIAICTILSAVPSALAGECADQSQSGLSACAAADYEKADAALNRSYKQIVSRLKDDPATAKLLAAAEKAWIAYRDAECAFASSANVGGTIYPMVVSMCLEAMTKKRNAELDIYLKCGDGELGCPVPAKQRGAD